jgi:hypothetical protein
MLAAAISISAYGFKRTPCNLHAILMGAVTLNDTQNPKLDQNSNHLLWCYTITKEQLLKEED